MFLAGWVFGLVVQTVLFVEGSGALGDMHNSTPRWASWLRVVLGLLGHQGSHTESPAWMRSFSTMPPRRAAITGLVLAVVRLEVLLMCMAASLAIGTSHLDNIDKLSAGVVFVAVSASTVAVSILAYVAAGHRLDDLERVKNWTEKNNAAMLAVILVLIGLMVLHNGIRVL